MKIDPTTQHFKAQLDKPDFTRTLAESPDTPANRNPVPRLCKSGNIEPLPFSYEDYAQAIDSSSLKDHVFFLDTCFLKRDEIPQCFWDAILQRTICITDLVDYELRHWQSNASVNKGFRDLYLDAKINGHTAIQFLPAPSTNSIEDKATRHYVTLLSLRKEIFNIVRSQLESEKGVVPTEIDVQAQVHKLVRDRGMQIASKGKKDAGKQNYLADEYLIVQAFVFAITSGRDVTVLTRDRDLSEQFYKTVYLVDTHYRSLLLADAYVEQPLNFYSEHELQGSFPAFEQLRIVKIPAGMEYRVLPGEFKFANIHVDRVVESNSDLSMLSLRFCAETEMARVFAAKANTDGLNTEKLGGWNLHRCPHPTMPTSFPSLIAISKDKYCEFNGVRLSLVDTELALTPCERGAAIVTKTAAEDLASQDSLQQAIRISSFKIPQRLTAVDSREFSRTSIAAVSLAIEMMEPWTRFLVTSELISLLPKKMRDALSTHDCCVLPSGKDAMNAVKLQANVIEKFESEDDRKIVDYYSALLAHRKMFGRVCELELQKELKRAPTTNQIRRRLQDYCDASCWLRAKDYLDRSIDDSSVFDDEKIVVDAFFRAICDGRETLILTQRREVVEQFITMAKVIESHYRSWAIAREGCLGLSQYERKDLDGPGLENCFQSNVYRLKLSKEAVNAAMPRKSLEIDVQCWLLEDLLQKQVRAYPVGFPVEPAMVELFKTKSQESLRSAEGLDGRNLHFQWAGTNDANIFGQFWLAADRLIKIGSDYFPSDPRLQLSIAEVPAMDLVIMTAHEKQLPFPWAVQARAEKLREERKRSRKRNRRSS